MKKHKFARFAKKMFVHDKNYRKVRNHCHYTGEYRAPAYSLCNLKYNSPKENNVVFQNMQNCDYRFIVMIYDKHIIKSC